MLNAEDMAWKKILRLKISSLKWLVFTVLVYDQRTKTFKLPFWQTTNEDSLMVRLVRKFEVMSSIIPSSVLENSFRPSKERDGEVVSN